MRNTVLQAIVAVGGHVDDLSRRFTATATRDDLHASQAPLLDAVAALASRVDATPQRTAALGTADVQAHQAAVLAAITALANRFPQHPTSLIPGAVITTPQAAAYASPTTSGLYLSARKQ